MVFSEFGRRVAENANLGTDHGTAGLAFVAGQKVRGGHYGVMPSLIDLDDGNMRYTTDFRRLYATMIRCWMGYSDARMLKDEFVRSTFFPRLRENHAPLPRCLLLSARQRRVPRKIRVEG